jgi:phosphopantetheinyl transferase
MVVNWGEELGIDIEVLRTEAFTHPSQILLHNKLHKQADDYWVRVAHQAGVQRVQELIAEAEAPAQKRMADKNRKRRERANKLRRYVFTKVQMRIALGSLNAKDPM